MPRHLTCRCSKIDVRLAWPVRSRNDQQRSFPHLDEQPQSRPLYPPPLPSSSIFGLSRKGAPHMFFPILPKRNLLYLSLFSGFCLKIARVLPIFLVNFTRFLCFSIKFYKLHSRIRYSFHSSHFKDIKIKEAHNLISPVT